MPARRPWVAILNCRARVRHLLVCLAIAVRVGPSRACVKSEGRNLHAACQGPRPPTLKKGHLAS